MSASIILILSSILMIAFIVFFIYTLNKSKSKVAENNKKLESLSQSNKDIYSNLSKYQNSAIEIQKQKNKRKDNSTTNDSYNHTIHSTNALTQPDFDTNTNDEDKHHMTSNNSSYYHDSSDSSSSSSYSSSDSSSSSSSSSSWD